MVQSVFAVNDLAVLQDCWADFAKKIGARSESLVEQLLGAMNSTSYNLISRSIGAEIFILKSVRDQKDTSCTA
jgi:hypothetical protein